MNRRDALKKLAAGGAGAGAAAVAASGEAEVVEPMGFAVFVRSVETKEVPLTEAEIEAERREREERRKTDPWGELSYMMLDMMRMGFGGGDPPTKTVRAEPSIPFTPVGAVDEWNSDAGRYDPAAAGEGHARFGCVPLKNAILFASHASACAFAACLVSVDGIEGGYYASPLHVGDTSEYESLEWEVRQVFASDLASPDAARPVPGSTPQPARPWPTIGDRVSFT